MHLSFLLKDARAFSLHGSCCRWVSRAVLKPPLSKHIKAVSWLCCGRAVCLYARKPARRKSGQSCCRRARTVSHTHLFSKGFDFMLSFKNCKCLMDSWWRLAWAKNAHVYRLQVLCGKIPSFHGSCISSRFNISIEQLTFNSCMNGHICTKTARSSPGCVEKQKKRMSRCYLQEFDLFFCHPTPMNTSMSNQPNSIDLCWGKTSWIAKRMNHTYGFKRYVGVQNQGNLSPSYAIHLTHENPTNICRLTSLSLSIQDKKTLRLTCGQLWLFKGCLN